MRNRDGGHWLKQQEKLIKLKIMFRKLLEEIDSIDLLTRGLASGYGVFDPEEGWDHVCELSYDLNLIRNLILIEDTRKQQDALAELIRTEAANHVEKHDRSEVNEDGSCGCEAYLEEALRKTKQFKDLGNKIDLLRIIFSAELEEVFPHAKEFDQLEHRDGGVIVGKKIDPSQKRTVPVFQVIFSA